MSLVSWSRDQIMRNLEYMARGVWIFGLRAVWKLGPCRASLAGRSVSWCLGERMVV